VDRGNERVKTMYDPFHPAVLRLIANTVGEAVKHNIGVSMCGEMAGDILATPLLVGMGLQSLSMTAAGIPRIKRSILHGSHVRAQQITATVMQMDDACQIKEYLNQALSNW
jgi:phosphoenolpyruvate-protein kinase (PTS system EI component)